MRSLKGGISDADKLQLLNLAPLTLLLFEFKSEHVADLVNKLLSYRI